MTATIQHGEAGVSTEVHTNDAVAYARTIHHGLTERERRALAAIYEDMPCSVSAVARISGTSRRTAQRACDALEGEQIRLIQRVKAGLIVHPEAIGAVDAWAHRHGSRSPDAKWWEESATTPVLDGRRYPQDSDTEPWPGDVFPANATAEVDFALAVRSVESRRTPLNSGTFMPFAVLNYAATASFTAAKIALECGRRMSRYGIAEFERGELARVTGMSPGAASRALARMREDGIATTATTTRIELDLRRA